MKKRPKSLQKILEAGGGPAEIARRLGIKTASVSEWKKVPAARVFQIAELTGLPVDEIRPDMVA